MADTTELRAINLIGPKLALEKDDAPDSTHFCWNANLAVSYLGKNRPDLTLVNSTLGLRIVLQAPESDAPTPIRIDIAADPQNGIEPVHTRVDMRVPRLLTANVQARGPSPAVKQSSLGFGGAAHRYLALAAKPEKDPDTGKEMRGFSTLLVTPLDPWPTPQTTVEIEVPRLSLAANRLRILINAAGGTAANPLGFLRLAKMDATKVAAFVGENVTDLKKCPRIELPIVKVTGVTDPFVALELTPDGIEFRGTIANPLRAFGDTSGPPGIDVVLRLAHIADPLQPEIAACWTLELVREEDAGAAGPDKIGERIRKALSTVRSKFHPSATNPLFLDINTIADDLAVRWPLDLKDKSVRLPGTAADDWTLWVDRNALRGGLNGAPVRDGELSTQVAIVPNRIELKGSAAGVRIKLDADRRDVSEQDGDPDSIPGPKVTLTAGAIINASIAASNKVPWFLDQQALIQKLVERYSKAGVHPDGAVKTYAFLPVADGWLQLPLQLRDEKNTFKKAAGALRDAVGFDGSVEYVLDDQTGGAGPLGRRIAISAADYVHAEATLKDDKIEDLSVVLSGAAGTADGVLWLAAGSPSAADVLPGFDAGPAALNSPTLAFRRGTEATKTLRPLISSDFAPGKALKLTLQKIGSKDTAYLWSRYVEMPMVTAIGMTRTSESCGTPSATRGLVCRALDLSSCDIHLNYDGAQGIPTLTLSSGTPETLPLADDRVKDVPLVPVTLPGIEMEPAASKFADLRTRLRFDLPVLDDLFANTRLPEKKAPESSGDVPVPLPPPDAPTSLDFDRLRAAWRKAVDRLDLSRVQIANAFEFSAQNQNAVAIGTLIEGITWSPKFSLKSLSQIGGISFGFGTYTLDGQDFSGRGALQGLSKTFALGEITDVAPGDGDPVKVVGFAAPLREQKFGNDPLWRDTRAALMARMPTTDNFGGTPAGIVFRGGGVIEAQIKQFTYATIFDPVMIESGDTNRDLGLWFRDLPLEAKGGGLGLVASPDGPELSIGPRQSAFDRSQLPSAIYEWRVCNDAKTPDPDKPSSAYEIDIGAFRLRPLRLLDLRIKKVAAVWQIDAAKILFTVSLKPKAEVPIEPGPFEAEPAYASGNLVAIALKAAPGKLSFFNAKWEDVQVADKEPIPPASAVTSGGTATVSFRKSKIPVKLASNDSSAGDTTAVLGLTVASAAAGDGSPVLSKASLRTVLFGREINLEDGVVQASGGPLIVTFQPPAIKALADFSGVLLDQIKVEIADADNWKIVLDGTLTIAASDQPEPNKPWPKAGLAVISYKLGDALGWLNLSVPAKFVETAIDHQRGVVKVRTDWAPASTIEPIVGLLAKNSVVRAALVVAIGDEENGKTFAFRSVSGFGEINLTSAGPLKRFDHMVTGVQNNVWSSAIAADLVLEKRRSRIRWPIGSLPATVKVGANDIKLENLGAQVTGAALRVQIGQFKAADALTHIFTMKVTGQAIKTSLLEVTDKPRRAAFGKPWSFQALTEHTLAPNTATRKRRRLAAASLKWTSLDHVSAVDAKGLVTAAKDATTLPPSAGKAIFAFAARYKDISPETEDDSIVVKAGLVLRAFAQAGFPVQALALELNNIEEQNVPDGIIISGAGPSVIRISDELERPFWPAVATASNPDYITKDQQGIVLALPWLVAVNDLYKLSGVFEPAPDGAVEWFDQAPAGAPATWDAPDVDWAAGSLTTLGRRTAPLEAITENSAEIAALLQRAAQNGGDRDANRPLAAVEQVFLRRFKGGAALRERPIWLRSLVALRTLSGITLAKDETFGERVTMVVPSGKPDGKVARVRLLPRAAADDPRPLYRLALHGQLVAIDRQLTKFETIPSNDSIIAESPGNKGVALSRARQVARADRLVDEPVAIIVIAERQTDEKSSATLWIDVEVPRDLDNSALDIPIEIDPTDRLYASPALGWPTRTGTNAAASGAMGMGGDLPFQDVGPTADPPPQDPDDVKRYGSGLSGRTASVSLPARADRTENYPLPIDTVSPPFYTLGRKMIFDRPDAASLPLVSPPARHLTSSGARAVVPTAKELETVLERVVRGKAAPIVPPHLERTTFGLRPGAVQAEFDMLVFSEGIGPPKRENMNPDEPRFGRPGHGGPRLMRQVRPPRGPALPRLPSVLVKSHGRRTFVEVDDLEADGRFAAPFRLFEGVASVLRRKEMSFRVRVLEMPLTPEWNRPVRAEWKQGNVTLDLTSPSFPKGEEKRLSDALGALGLLRKGPAGLDAALSIDRFIVPFNDAVWSKSPNGGGVRLTLHAADIAGALSRLDQVDGDSEVVLQLRCGNEADSFDPPDEGKIFDLATRPGIQLTGQAWANSNNGGQITFKTSANHGVPVGNTFTVSGSAPSGFNGEYVAVAGTAANVLVAAKAADPGASSGLGIVTTTYKTLEPESRRQIALRLPVRLTDQPSLNIDMSTLVFADPSYDRELAGPGPSDPQRNNQGKLWKLVLDRFEYGSDTPLYFAFGLINPATGLFDAANASGSLRLQRQPFENENNSDGSKKTVPPEDLMIAGVTPIKPKNLYSIDADKAYGISFDQLRFENRPVSFKDGDEIVVSVAFTDPDDNQSRTLSCRSKVVMRPIIAPPPAVYSLVVPAKDKTARAVLHAAAPLPQRIEFPDLLKDLAIGHVRRQALFIWPTSTLPAQAADAATLVKIDRAGGGQLPERATDIPRREPLPQLFKLRLLCTAPPANRGKEADIWIAIDSGPSRDGISSWSCPEQQPVFFNTHAGIYKTGGTSNLLAPDGATAVGVVTGFDAETTRVRSKGVGESRETAAKFEWTVTDVTNG